MDLAWRVSAVAAQYLAAAGIGQLTLLDFDTMSLSNPQRQTLLHSDATLGQPKVDSAPRRAGTHQPARSAHDAECGALEEEALRAQIAAHDLVLDCTDNVAIRNQLNVGCFLNKTPLVSGAAIRMEGQISVLPGRRVSRAIAV